MEPQSQPLARSSGVVGFSAVLPENGLLKKLAFLFDRVVCDNLSFHFVAGESEGMRVRSAHEWNTAYDARVRELRWLMDAGVLSPLANFAEEIGLSRDELNRIRDSSQTDAAPLVHGEGQKQAAAFISAYERLLAARLQSYEIEVVSITPVKRFVGTPQESGPGEDDTVVELLLGAMPCPDELAPWNTILELRRDPMLEVKQQDLWRLIRSAGAEDLTEPELDGLRDLLRTCETLLRSHAVKIAHGPLQSTIFVRDRFNPNAIRHNVSPEDVTARCHRSEPIWREHLQPGRPISAAFADVPVLADLQSEVPIYSVDFATMISFSDLGREKPSVEDLIALAHEINVDAGITLLGRFNSYLSLTHLSNDRETISRVQRQLSIEVLSPARLGEIDARFADQELYKKWILLHRAQLLAAIKLVARHGRREGGNRLKSAEDKATVGELAIAINSYYGPGLTDADKPLLGDALARMAAEMELQRPPDWHHGLVRTRMLLGPLLRDFSADLKSIDAGLPPFERIFTLLNGLNFRDFLDITFYLLIQQDRNPQKAIDAGLSWCVDVAEFNPYVSGRSLKAWADVMSIEPNKINDLIQGSEGESSFFYDFTEARLYPLWRPDDHRYFAIDWFFLMERLSSTGAYWTVVNGLVDEALRKQFQGVWGELIQEYVRDLVKRCVERGVGSFLRRPTYEDGSTEVFDSGVVIGASMVAIEIKGSVVPDAQKYAGEAGPFFQGLSSKFGSGRGAAVEQLLRNIGAVFAKTDAQHAPSIPTGEIKEVFPVAIVHEPVLCSGFATHALAAEFNAGVSQLELISDIQIHPLQVMAIGDLENLEPYLIDQEFTITDCLRAKIYEDPKHHWAFWDFIRQRYLPSRGIAPRGNVRLNAVFDWLVESVMWRTYRGDYREPSFGNIERSERACVCVRPLDGDDVLLEEWKVFSEHSTAAEAYSAFDELFDRGVPKQELGARRFELLVADQFGVEIPRPG